MSVPQVSQPIENRLLDKLAGEDLEELRPHLARVSLSHGDHTIAANEPIRDIYFPLNCLLSMVTLMEDGSSVESGIIGREGMSGIPILLDAAQTPMPTFTQIPGDALKVRAEIVKEVYDRRGSLFSLLNRYIHTVVVTGSQTAACNALHQVEARMCRWLLMSSDGIGSDDLNLTQEFLATMLGVRRASVSEIAGRLKDEELIRYSRGRILILDRDKLEAAACECYRNTKGEYDRLFS